MYEDASKDELIRLLSLRDLEIEHLKKSNDDLKNEIQKIKNMVEQTVNRDPLTGLYNRKVVQEAYEKCQTAIMCDIDDFKKLNDTYGHNFGDEVLVNVAKIISSSVRSIDYVVRWGGEEFIIFVDNPNVEVASLLAERIRTKIENLHLTGHNIDDVPRITMCFGVSRFHVSDSLVSDIEKVDMALYHSKKSGKNKVTLFDESILEENNKLNDDSLRTL